MSRETKTFCDFCGEEMTDVTPMLLADYKYRDKPVRTYIYATRPPDPNPRSAFIQATGGNYDTCGACQRGLMEAALESLLTIHTESL